MSKFIEVSFLCCTSYIPEYILINVDKIIHVRNEDGYAVITLPMDCEQTHDFKTNEDYEDVVREILKVCGQPEYYIEEISRSRSEIRVERELPF